MYKESTRVKEQQLNIFAFVLKMIYSDEAKVLKMKQIWIFRGVWHRIFFVANTSFFFLLCYSSSSLADTSEAALLQLQTLGAQIEMKSDHMGNRGVMITVGSLWNGGEHGLSELKNVEGLFKLRVSGNISDAGIDHIAALTELKALDLHLIKMSDAGVRKLQEMTNLERLNLTYTQVTDDGLKYLYKMKNLQWLGLAYTNVSRKGVNELKKELTKTLIEGRFK